MNRAGDVVERDAFTHSRGKIGFHGFGSIGVVYARAFSLCLSRDATLNECRLEYVSHELQRGNIGPQRFERI